MLVNIAKYSHEESGPVFNIVFSPIGSVLLIFLPFSYFFFLIDFPAVVVWRSFGGCVALIVFIYHE